MFKYNCYKCTAELTLYNVITPHKYYFFCKRCIKNTKFCSMSKCRKLFLLNNDDLKGLKYLYFDNPNNNTKFFVYNEIEKIIINKYSNFQTLYKFLKAKQKKKEERLQIRQNKINKRKKELISVLHNNKLEFKYRGDAYSYIHYGEPSLQEVVTGELNKIEEKNERRVKLARKLSKLGIVFDEKSTHCYNYINNIGSKNLYETIRAIELDSLELDSLELNSLSINSINNHSKNINNIYKNKNNSNTTKNCKPQIILSFD